VITVSINLLTVVVLCSWLHDIDTRLRRMENPYR
jgi:hypothetical protein